MNQHLQKAYEVGAHAAHAEFEKIARGEVITPLLGAVTPLGAGIAGGVSAPQGDRFAAGLGSGTGSLLGMGLGSVAGAGLGGVTGLGVHRLAKALGKDIDPDKAFRIGALVGGLGGAMGGGAAGASAGRRLALGPEKTSNEKIAKGDMPVSALGAIPLVGPTAAGMASRAYSPAGEEDVIAPMTSSRALKGQLIGGLGGAALGAGDRKSVV